MKEMYSSNPTYQNAVTEKQHKCIEHLELESERYGRLAQRAEEIGCKIYAITCRQIAKMLKDSTELQCKMLLHPEKYLPFASQDEEKTLIK